MTGSPRLSHRMCAAAAAGVSPPGLEKLHEIALPAPVSWMPHTIGWYAIFGLIFLAVGGWGYRRLRRFLGNRYRRLALAELAVIEGDLARPGKRAGALAALSVLIRRTALTAFPRSEVAALSGERWLVFLDRTMDGKGFAEGEGRLLSELPYAPASRLEALPEAAIGELLRLARCWITTHAAI